MLGTDTAELKDTCSLHPVGACRRPRLAPVEAGPDTTSKITAAFSLHVALSWDQEGVRTLITLDQ